MSLRRGGDSGLGRGGTEQVPASARVLITLHGEGDQQIIVVWK
jgi:hypothetical protein